MMALKYIITNLILGNPIEQDGKFIYNTNIRIGIEGDRFDLSINDGNTIDITEVSGTPAEIKEYLMAEAQKFVDQKYNTPPAEPEA